MPQRLPQGGGKYRPEDSQKLGVAYADPVESGRSVSAFRNSNIAILPFPALGDTTIYLRLAQSLADAGARVSMYSEMLLPAADLLPWLTITAPSISDIGSVLANHDLVIADILAPQIARGLTRSGPGNLLCVTAKEMPKDFLPPPVPKMLRELQAAGGSPVHRAFCPGAKCGISMVAWVDRYATETQRLKIPPNPPPLAIPQDWKPDGDVGRRILLFPTTPNPSKNYPLTGFRRLSALLSRRGWLPEVICMPNELTDMHRVFPPAMVRSFPSLRELILHIMKSYAIISNDSGGGHLGSMLGRKTFTITKKSSDFLISHNVQPPSKTVRAAAAWRPGRRAGASGWTTGRNDD